MRFILYKMTINYHIIHQIVLTLHSEKDKTKQKALKKFHINTTTQTQRHELSPKKRKGFNYEKD